VQPRSGCFVGDCSSCITHENKSHLASLPVDALLLSSVPAFDRPCNELCSCVCVRADMMGSAQEMFRRAGIELPPDMMAVHGRWQSCSSSSRPGAALSSLLLRQTVVSILSFDGRVSVVPP
jgi:hypothetical protein